MCSLFNCRSRQEYIELLLNDLCTYYSYGKFLMEKFVELFPLNEVKQQERLSKNEIKIIYKDKLLYKNFFSFNIHYSNN